MAKVYIGVGHGGSDPGAVKYIKEKDVNLVTALACRDYLKANGVQVKISRTKDVDKDLDARIKECNTYKPDLAVDIHNNAGKGDGFEVYHTIKGGKGKTLAKNIEKEVKAIGQNSRGLKTKKRDDGTDYYGFIRWINYPAVICEGVFVDNKADAAQADTKAEQQAFGVAYAKGILKTLGIAEKKNTSNNTDKPKLTIEKIDKIPIKLKIDANLWDLNFVTTKDAKSVKQYKTGDIIGNIVAIVTHSCGHKYYMTEYSYTNNIMNGFNILDGDKYEQPKEEPKQERCCANCSSCSCCGDRSS